MGDLLMTFNPQYVTSDLKGCRSSSSWSDVPERSKAAVNLPGMASQEVDRSDTWPAISMATADLQEEPERLFWKES